MSKVVAITAKLAGGRQIEKEADAGASGIKKLGESVKKTDDEAGKASKGWALFSRNQKKAADDAKKTHSILKSVVGAGAGLAGGYIGFSTVTGAIDKVKESAQEINKLQSMGVGGSDQQTLDIISAFKARGIGAEALGKTMKKLATSTQTAERQEYTFSLGQAKAAASGKQFTSLLGTSATAFKELGINAQAFSKLAPEKQFEEIATKLSNLPTGMDKTRIATQLLGRGAAQLLPILNKGALGWEAQLKAAKEFMPHLSGGKKGFEELEVQESRMSMATEGLKQSLGEKLLPVALTAMKFFTKLSANIEHGTGVWGKLGHVLGEAGGFFKGVYGWLTKTKVGIDVLTVALSGLAVLWVVSKVMGFIEAIKLVAIVTKIWAAAQWLVNAALDANPIGLVIIGLAALAAGFYFAYTKIKWFETGVTDVWKWIKANWPLLAQILLTPILGPAVLILFHWKQVVNFFKKVPGDLASAGKGMWDFVKEGFRSAINWVLKGWDSLHFKVPGIKTPFGSVGGFNIGVPHIPLLGWGGTVRHAGSVIVGDRGPEMLSLPPGARVDPLASQTRGPGSIMGGFTNAANGDLHVHVEVAGREVAQAVFKEFKREQALA